MHGDSQPNATPLQNANCWGKVLNWRGKVLN
jgi:hypothetical protein